MKKNSSGFYNNLSKRSKAQAMVEFAIALPFLLLLLYGVIELARLAFIFSSASNASRAAARYGSGAGENAEGIPHYLDCDGIRDVADQSAYITDFSEVNITYDRGVNSDGTQIPIGGVDPNPSTDSCPIENINVRNGDRIIVQVSVDYEPIVPIVPIDPLEIVSSNARTFIVSIPILGSAIPTSFAAESSTPSKVAENFTSTPSGTAAFTPTRVPVNLTQYSYELTNAPTATLTFTPSTTPPPTHTSTITPTRIFCGGTAGIDNGPLRYTNNYIQMEIYNNTGHLLTVSEVYLAWNHDKGHQGDDQKLSLMTVSLGNQNWEGNFPGPSQSISEYHPRIPIGTSMIRFGFNQKYDILDGTERVIISLLTPGCEGYLLDSGS
jgi:hypothetical protein